MLCQACGAPNPDDQEYCVRCHQKLLVLSGAAARGARSSRASREAELLASTSTCSSASRSSRRRSSAPPRPCASCSARSTSRRRTCSSARPASRTLRELLERKSLIGREEWSDLWESQDGLPAAARSRSASASWRSRTASPRSTTATSAKVFLQHLEDAEYALFAFDVERAVDALEAAFKLDRDNYELALLPRRDPLQRGRAPSEALGYFQRVLEVKPDHFEGLVYSGVIRHERGDYDARRGAAEARGRALPGRLPAALQPGRGLRRARRPGARRRLPRARGARSTAVPQALYLLGSCCYEMGQARGHAVRCLREAVRHDPAFEEAHYLLGLAYLDRHWNQKALDSFREAQRLNPQADCATRTWCATSPGTRARRCPGRRRGRRRSLAPRRGATRRAASLKQAHRRLPAGARARAREPDAADVLRHALPAPRPQPGDRGAGAQGARPESRRDAARHRLRGADRGAAQPRASSARATASASELLERGHVRTSPAPSPTTRWPTTWPRWRRTSTRRSTTRAVRSSWRRTSSSSSRSPRSAGCTTSARSSTQAVEFLAKSSELGAVADTLTHLGMALLAAGEEERARSVFARAREPGAARAARSRSG